MSEILSRDEYVTANLYADEGDIMRYEATIEALSYVLGRAVSDLDATGRAKLVEFDLYVKLRDKGWL